MGQALRLSLLWVDRRQFRSRLSDFALESIYFFRFGFLQTTRMQRTKCDLHNLNILLGNADLGKNVDALVFSVFLRFFRRSLRGLDVARQERLEDARVEVGKLREKVVLDRVLFRRRCL